MRQCERVRVHEAEGVELLSGYTRVRVMVSRVLGLCPIGWQHIEFRGSACNH